MRIRQEPRNCVRAQATYTKLSITLPTPAFGAEVCSLITHSTHGDEVWMDWPVVEALVETVTAAFPDGCTIVSGQLLDELRGEMIRGAMSSEAVKRERTSYQHCFMPNGRLLTFHK